MLLARTCCLLALGLAFATGASAQTPASEAPAVPEASSDAAASAELVEALERRVEVLEREAAEERVEPAAASGLSRVAEHVSLGGSANAGYYDGMDAHPWQGKGFQVWDARFFVDAELGGPVELGGRTLVRNAGSSFEWNLVRIGRLESQQVGDLYIELQNLGGTGWLSAQVGRFQIPVGEGYLRYGKGYADNPFVSNAVAGAWFWDEGVKLYGASDGGLFSWVASVTENETQFDVSLLDDKQYTLKLMLDPLDWLHLSASGLYAGNVQIQPGSFASGESLWFGEFWLRQFGSYASAPSFVFGVPVPNGPTTLGDSWLVGGDVIARWPAGVDLWLSYSYYDSNQGSAFYDREFHAWLAELVLHGDLIDDALRDFYLGVRANAIGTYDDLRGHLLDVRSGAIGYNMSSLGEYSAVLGWQMLRGVTLRAEYTRREIELVTGTPLLISTAVDGMNAFALELGVSF